MKRKYHYLWTIRRNDPNKSKIFGRRWDWNWLEAQRNFPHISTPSKEDSRLFDSQDEAERFYLKKGKKYPWLWKNWWVCRIRVWVNGKKIMIGEKESQYVIGKRKKNG